MPVVFTANVSLERHESSGIPGERMGVGSITLDLSRIVDPGNVVGIDLDNEQLNFARSEATFVSPDRIAVKLKAWRLKYSKNYII